MSHFSNDIIVDDAIDTVANMDDRKVTDTLVFTHKLKPADWAQAMIDNDLANPAGTKITMDDLRDLLVSLTFADLMDRPHPHG